MKFNWGYGIVLVLAIAIGGFLTMVFITTGEKIDMVTEDYYPKELKYDNQIEKTRNYNALTDKVTITTDADINVVFPQIVDNEKQIKGGIHFYRPSDKQLDIEKEIKLDNEFKMVFDKKTFQKGKYELIIEWEDGQKPYLTKLDVYID